MKLTDHTPQPLRILIKKLKPKYIHPYFQTLGGEKDIDMVVPPKAPPQRGQVGETPFREVQTVRRSDGERDVQGGQGDS